MGLLTRETRQRLMEALTAIPVLDSSAGRGLLLQDLPPRLTPMIARSEAKLLDLTAIVDACDHWEPTPGQPHPLRLLIENARDLVTGSAIAIRLRVLLDTISASASYQGWGAWSDHYSYSNEGVQREEGDRMTRLDDVQPLQADEDRLTSLRAAYAAFLADLDDIGNPELLTKARELRSALQQDEPDVEHVTELRRWFAGRPGRARDTAAAFFNTPIVRQIIAEATQREYGG